MKITYPISVNYLSHWTIYDAVREFIQNAIDADETFSRDNITYFEHTKSLQVINKGEISTNSLLLGTTYKDGKNTIGQFGEGYKLGALVLNRNNKGIDIFSNENKFIFYISEHNEFNEQVLTLELNKCRFETYTKIDITNITKEEFKNITDNTLILQDYSYININHSQILTDLKHKGSIFVKGLFICNIPNLGYGYNFNTGIIPLDRDRSIVNTFDLSWECSKLWNDLCENNIEYIDELMALLKSDSLEVTYLKSFSTANLANKVYAKIKREGFDFIVSNNTDIFNLKSNNIIADNVLLTNETLRDIIILKATDYKTPKETNKYRKNAKPIDILNQYESEHDVHTNDWNELYNLAKNWRIKQ